MQDYPADIVRRFSAVLLALALGACSSPSPSSPESSPISETPSASPGAASPSEVAQFQNTAEFQVTGEYAAQGRLPLLPEETFGTQDKTTYLSFNDGTAVLTFYLSAEGSSVSLGIGQDLASAYFDPFYGDAYDFVVTTEACDFEFTRNDPSGVTGTFECADPVAVALEGSDAVEKAVNFTGSIDAEMYEPAWPPEPGTSEFDDGEYEVGVDIEPGTYRIREAATNCYWERLSSFSGINTDIIENSRADGFATVTVLETDVGFASTDCGHWTGDLSAVTDPNGPLAYDGVFIVGTDIAPGTWTSTGDPDADFRCEASRLVGFGGSELERIAGDFAETGGLTITIEPTDHGFETTDCGTWTRAN
jgi:hypothetical protein